MKRLPSGFRDEYEIFREQFERLARGVKEDNLDPESELLYKQNRAFLERWQSQVRTPDLERAFADLRIQLDEIGLFLEIDYLKALAALLDERRGLLSEPPLFEKTVAFIKRMQLTPEALRPPLEKIFRDQHGYDFDAERAYREREAAEEEYETEYRQLYSRMEVNWPDRFDPAVRARLALASIEELNQWKAEVAVRLEATNTKIAQFPVEDPLPEE